MESFEPDASSAERLAPTGSRIPGWTRLPKEPPFDPEPEPLENAAYRPVASPPGDHVEPSSGGSPRSRGWLQTIVAAVIGGALALGGAQLLGADDEQPADAVAAAPASTPSTTQAPQPLTVIPEAPSNAAAIGDAVIPAIVTVQVGDESPDGVFVRGSGSGVIIDAGGLIVTNDHVVAPGQAYQVVLSDGRTTYEAELVGTDPLTDLAVLRVDAPNLTPVELGSTEELRVGDRAVAVGSPLGLEGGPSLTVGVVSAFDRLVQVSADDTLYGMLQTDAPITQGSSGGALVDGQGRLIGITTAVGVSDVGIEGIGFATPVELVERVVNEIIATGDVRHALIGITGFTRFDDADDGARVAVGVEIRSVENESAAGAAGLEEGYIITALDGVPITTMEDLIATLRYLGAGDAIELRIDDGGSVADVPVTLGLRDE